MRCAVGIGGRRVVWVVSCHVTSYHVVSYFVVDLRVVDRSRVTLVRRLMSLLRSGRVAPRHLMLTRGVDKSR